ncbi:MAG: DUF1854 domain-containing protein [Alicyclobacillus sp.]|nr:DUF1854 domain-containing protein [Alicyclobacillus sp.]
MEELFEAKYLDADAVRLRHGERGVLEGDIDGETYPHLSLVRAFPLSKADGYLAVLAHTGEDVKEVGMIRSLAALDDESRQAAERELQLRYVVPRITRIDQIRQEPAFWRWRVETDRGPVELIMRNIHEHVRSAGPGRLLITDVDGRRFELADIGRLDTRSRALLRRYL